MYLNGSALRKNVSPQPSAGPLHPAQSAPKLFIGGKLCGEDLQYSPEEKEHNAKGTENETILGSEVPAGYQKRHMAAGGSSTKGAVHTLWPYLPKALASGSFPIEVAGGRGFQREGFPRSQLRHLAPAVGDNAQIYLALMGQGILEQDHPARIAEGRVSYITTYEQHKAIPYRACINARRWRIGRLVCADDSETTLDRRVKQWSLTLDNRRLGGRVAGGRRA